MKPLKRTKKYVKIDCTISFPEQGSTVFDLDLSLLKKKYCAVGYMLELPSALPPLGLGGRWRLKQLWL